MTSDQIMTGEDAKTIQQEASEKDDAIFFLSGRETRSFATHATSTIEVFRVIHK